MVHSKDGGRPQFANSSIRQINFLIDFDVDFAALRRKAKEEVEVEVEVEVDLAI